MTWSLRSTVRGTCMLVVLALLAEFAEGERNATFQKDQWTWLLACAGILGVGAAWGIGANDVANAFATSVGSGALSVKQAIMLGSVLEPLGAVLLGTYISKSLYRVSTQAAR